MTLSTLGTLLKGRGYNVSGKLKNIASKLPGKEACRQAYLPAANQDAGYEEQRTRQKLKSK